MILRKPYAFFIRHFKLIHLIMTGLIGFLIYKTNLILNFLNRYMASKELVTGRDLVEPLFGTSIFAALVLIILMSVIIFIVMQFKKKPAVFYFGNIITTIIMIVIFIFTQSTIEIMETRVVDLQTIRLVRDLMTIGMLLQSCSFVVNFIRGIGFNIKHFNFEADYHELNIDSKDNEEFELELSIDTSKFRRKMRKKIRHFKYVYAERKYIINLLILFTLLGIIFFVSFVLGLFDKKYKQGELFTTSNYVMGIDNSYLVTEDYKGNTVKEDTKFIVLDLNVKSRYTEGSFVVASSSLEINDQKFYHNRSYIEEFADLGNVFLDQKLTNEATNYLLVYEIPNDLVLEEVIFTITDSNLTYNVSINLKNLEKEDTVKDYNLGEIVVIEDLLKANIQINKYDLARNFKLDYQFCVSTNECYNSVEYLYPSLSGRTDKVLLKLNGSVDLQDNHISDIKNLSNFINYFGVIEYEKDGEVKKQKTGLKRVKPSNVKTDDYYIEVVSDVVNSPSLYLDFVIRDKTYRYKLK